MKTFKTFLEEIVKFDNFVFPDEKTMKADFDEYKKKEERKWAGRAERKGFRFPIFDTFDDWKSALKNAEVKKITKAFDSQIDNRSNSSSISSLKSLVSMYKFPRDVDRIVNGYKDGDPIPYPIILKGTDGMWIMAGNTRLDSAFILGITPTALVVDVSKSNK